MQAIAVVFLYVLFTLPFLGLLLWVLRMKGDTQLLRTALLLQLIPVGLVYLPLGVAGVVLLAFTLVSAARRNHQFRTTGIRHPELERAWSDQYRANLWALGFALEQKGAAWLFVQVVARHGFAFLWQELMPASVVLWAVLGWLLAKERRLAAGLAQAA